MDPVGAPTQVHAVRVVQAPVQQSYQVRRGICHTGIIQICIGLAAIITNTVCTLTTSIPASYIGPGYWCGLMCIIAGPFGVAAYRIKSRGYIVTYMVLSILSALISTSLIIIAVPGIAMSADQCEIIPIPCPDWIDLVDCGSQYTCKADAAGIVLNALLLACGAVEIMVAAVASTFCCNAIYHKPTAGVNNFNGMPNSMAPPMLVYAYPSQDPMYGNSAIIAGQPAPGYPFVVHPMAVHGQAGLYPGAVGGWQNGAVIHAPPNQTDVKVDNIQTETASPNAVTPAATDLADQRPPAYSYY